METKLKYVAVTLLLIGTASAVVVTQTDIVNMESSAIDQVPSDSDFVSQIDMALLEDENTKELVNTALETDSGYTSVESLDDSLDQFENESGIDPRDVEELVAYGKIPEDSLSGESYFGTIAHAEWSLDTLLNSIRSESEQDLEERSYKGNQVYVLESESVIEGQNTDSLWIAEIATGQYALGTENAVKDAVDVSEGDKAKLSGELLTAYENTRDGYVRFASRIPESQIPSESSTTSSGPDLSSFREISYVSGSYYSQGENIGINMNMEAEGEESAEDIQDAIDGGISLISSLTSDESAEETLDKIEISMEDTTVKVSYQDSVNRLTDLMESQ